MELIRDVIEWIGNESGSTAATLFPYGLVGLVGLYVLWLVIGYLRVSQVGVRDSAAPQPAIAPPPATDSAEPPERPSGVPYCSFDGLQYPLGATFCAACERDLSLDCATCGATNAATETSCFRCGTPTGAPAQKLLA